jgi:hypothetical protein
MSSAPPRTPSSSTSTAGRGHGHSTPRGRGPPRQAPPTPIHQQSGVPFGYVPAYLPGSASLVEELDQRLLVVLRDGKHLVGVSLCLTESGL